MLGLGLWYWAFLLEYISTAPAILVASNYLLETQSSDFSPKKYIVENFMNFFFKYFTWKYKVPWLSADCQIIQLNNFFDFFN